MPIRVRSEAELNQQDVAELIQPGVYPFEVKAAIDQISKAGNETIKLTLELKTPTGKRCIYDYLVDTNRGARKIRHFCDATGAQTQYLDANECRGHRGMVDVTIKAAENGYAAQNAVVDYVADPAISYAKSASEDARVDELMGELVDDDVPF